MSYFYVICRKEHPKIPKIDFLRVVWSFPNRNFEQRMMKDHERMMSGWWGWWSADEGWWGWWSAHERMMRMMIRSWADDEGDDPLMSGWWGWWSTDEGWWSIERGWAADHDPLMWGWSKPERSLSGLCSDHISHRFINYMRHMPLRSVADWWLTVWLWAKDHV